MVPVARGGNDSYFDSFLNSEEEFRLWGKVKDLLQKCYFNPVSKLRESVCTRQKAQLRHRVKNRLAKVNYVGSCGMLC